MKTIIWKELRENLKWALLAMVALGLAEFYVLSHQRSGGGANNELSICESTYLMVTAFGCSAVGAVLAAVQILPELRRDQWAALLHRPVPRQTIFFGKVAAGLVLYLMAAGAPLLMSVAYAAMPGQFAGPLVPGMILPPLSDLAMGIAFYFGALLISLHRGPWWGSRGLLGLALAPVLLAQFILPWLFVFPLVMSLVFLIAGRAIMVSNGVVAEQPRIGRYCHVFLLLVGSACLLVVLLIGLSFVKPSVKFVTSVHDFRLTRDGQVFVHIQEGDTSRLTLPDSDGKALVTDERYIGNNNYQSFSQFYPLCEYNFGPLLTQRYIAKHPRNMGNYLEQAVWNNYDSTENWYVIVGKDYFVGYDKLSRRPIGICDRDGFHPAGTLPKPFPEKLLRAGWNFSAPYLYNAGKQLYSLDFGARSMKPILLAEDSSIHGAIGLRSETGKAIYFAVALDKEVRLLDLEGKLLGATPYLHDPTVWSDLSAGIPAKAGHVFLRADRRNFAVIPKPDPHPQLCFVDELDLKGAVIHTYSMPTDQPMIVPPAWTDRVAIGAMPMLPSVIAVVATRISSPDDSGLDDLPVSMFPLGGWRAMLEVQAVVGAILVCLAFFWGRKAGLPIRDLRLWSVWVFCFGLPGLLVFRLAAHWPTRVSCPHCAVRRPVETEECPACHSAWLAPLRNGTEIFE